MTTAAHSTACTEDRRRSRAPFAALVMTPALRSTIEREAAALLDGANPQPVTLAPVIRPTRREMRAAYRRNGDPIPANLRGGFFQGWMA